MKRTRFAAFGLAVLLLFSLPSCKKEKPAEKPYKPYDFDLASYIRLGDMLGVPYTPFDTSVTDDEVNARLCEKLESVGFYEPEEGKEQKQENVTEGTVLTGDIIRFSASATVDGAPYPDASTASRTVTVGKQSVALDGFDVSLVGLPIGTPTALTLTFPSDYADFSLRRKEVVFTVTVERVERRLLLPASIPQEWVEKLTDQSLPLYIDALRQEIASEKEEYAAKKKVADCWMAALDRVTLISYPQSEMERYVSQYRGYTEEQGKKAGFATLTDYEKSLGITDEELTAQGMAYARGDVLQEMVVYAVARSEGFDEMSDELFARYALPYAEELGLSDVSVLIEAVGFDAVQKKVLTEVVKQYIADNAAAPAPAEPTDDPASEPDDDPAPEG